MMNISIKFYPDDDYHSPDERTEIILLNKTNYTMLNNLSQKKSREEIHPDRPQEHPVTKEVRPERERNEPLRISPDIHPAPQPEITPKKL